MRINIPIIGCEMIVPGGQTFPVALTYTNVKTGSKEELTIHTSAAEELEYEVFCGDHLVLAAEDGSLEGTLTGVLHKQQPGGSHSDSDIVGAGPGPRGSARVRIAQTTICGGNAECGCSKPIAVVRTIKRTCT